MMKYAMAILSAVLAATMLDVSAAPAESSPTAGTPSCAAANRIRSWKEIDDRHIYVSYVDKKRRYLVTFLGPCREIRWASMLVAGRRGLGRCLTRGDHLIFKIHPHSPGESCMIWDVQFAPVGEKEHQPQPRKRHSERPVAM